jgi:hypothetical protein
VSGSLTRSRIVAGVVVLAALVGIVLVMTSDNGSTQGASDNDRSSTTEADVSSSTTAPGAGAAGIGGVREDPNHGDTTPLPVDVKVTGTEGLHAGDEVTVTVSADKGSKIYGLEMRQCREGTKVRNDGDMRPSVAGSCALNPLSAGADSYKVVPSEGDRVEMTATYKVGVGSDTFPLGDGGTSTVTCDHAHPCVLAVKYQIPDGFGFRTYPLTFA